MRAQRVEVNDVFHNSEQATSGSIFVGTTTREAKSRETTPSPIRSGVATEDLQLTAVGSGERWMRVLRLEVNDTFNKDEQATS
jgi:hypothetical protein